MAEEGELSKRIDETHRRLDDLRGDMNTRFGELRADMNRWMGVVDTRFGVMDQRFSELRADMNARLTAVDQRIKALNWSMTVWFSLLTLLIVLFKAPQQNLWVGSGSGRLPRA